MRILLSISCSLLLLGCKQTSLTEGEIPGTYNVKYSHGSERLVLGTDKTFTQIYMPLQGSNLTNSGKWSYSSQNRCVYLNEALIFDSGENEKLGQPRRTVWSLGILSFPEEIQLVVSDQAGLAFTKAR